MRVYIEQILRCREDKGYIIGFSIYGSNGYIVEVNFGITADSLNALTEL